MTTEKTDRRSFLKNVGAFVGGAVVGAGAYGAYSYTQPQPTPTPTTTTTTTATITTSTPWNYVDAAAPYRGAKLNAAFLSGELLEKAAQDKKDEWSKTGIDFELDLLGYTTLNDKLQSTFRAGLPTYDFFVISGPDSIRYYNYVEKLEPYLENAAITDPQLNLWDFTVEDFSGYWNFDTNQPEMPGNIIGINVDAGGQAMVYRKDLLEKAGVSEPKTWDDYLEAVRATTDKDKGIYGTAFVGKVDPSLALMEWYIRFASIGGKMFDGNSVEKNVHFNLDSAESVEAANRLYELLPYSPAGVTSYGFTESMGAFQAGKAALITIWSAVAATLFNKDSNPLADVTVMTPVPGKGGFSGIANKGGGHLAIPKSAKNKEAAWLWIQWYASKEICKYRLLNGHTGPIRYSVMHDPEVIQKMPYIAVVENVLKKAKYFPTYGLPNSPEVIDVINTNLNSALTGQMTVEEACTKANDGANALAKRDGLGG